jgi:type I restriction enzyme S subunit
MQDDAVNWQIVPFVEIDDTKAQNYLLENNDIVFARTGATVGKSFLIKDLMGKAIFASYLIRIKLKKNFDVQYVKYFFESGFYWQQIQDKAIGTGQPNVNGTLLGELLIPLPPLAVQKQIVSQIETLFAEIDRIEQSRQNLLQVVKMARQKVLQEFLNGEWKTVKLGEVLSAIETKKPTGATFRYIDIDAIDNKQHIIKEPKILDVENAPSRASRGLKYGDTLFSMVRPYLENIAFVEEEFANCIASTGFFVCRPKETILPKYLYYLMLSPFVVDGLNSFMKGDNSPSINNNHITSFSISLPPIPVQKQIVEKIETVFGEIEKIERAII